MNTPSKKFIAWYCAEPRLGFNRPVVVRYRSFLESLSLSVTTINLHLSAIRRLADESAESGWLSPELVTGIRRVKGVKPLGRRIGNWLTGNQVQELLNAVSQNTLRSKRDGAMLASIDNLAPHDLRRSCARLCYGSGGELEQIQFLLGHASVQTTERYIGCKQSLKEAVNDRFGIAVASHPA